jgi:hypothetical protein
MNVIKKIFKVRKYVTPLWIKQEFIDFLKWSDPTKTDEEYNKMLDSYFEEKDISLHGDLRKMHGSNTRNYTTELSMLLCSISIAIILVILMAIYIH